MGKYIIWIIVAYLIGNFATSYLISKILGKIDIREHGSGNAGATNVLRVLGVKAALPTFVGDALKGAIAVLFVKSMGDIWLTIAVGLAVILGHNFPILLKFKGGKGIATSIGVFLAIDPIGAIFSILLGLLLIIKTKYVSLGSVGGMALLPIILLILGRPFEIILFGLLIGLLAVFQHRANIKRLLNGTESKLGSKKANKNL